MFVHRWKCKFHILWKRTFSTSYRCLLHHSIPGNSLRSQYFCWIYLERRVWWMSCTEYLAFVSPEMFVIRSILLEKATHTHSQSVVTFYFELFSEHILAYYYRNLSSTIIRGKEIRYHFICDEHNNLAFKLEIKHTIST